MIPKPKRTDYEQWLEANPDLVAKAKTEAEECDICAGTGYCGECDLPCRECGEDPVPNRLWNWYKEQQAADAKKLAAWKETVAKSKEEET